MHVLNPQVRYQKSKQSQSDSINHQLPTIKTQIIIESIQLQSQISLILNQSLKTYTQIILSQDPAPYPILQPHLNRHIYSNSLLADPYSTNTL